MKLFDQDSILVGDGKTLTLHFRDGSTADLGGYVSFRPEIIRELPGNSRIKGRKFGMTNQDHARQKIKNVIDKPDENPISTGIKYGGRY